jgi:hypothetical protein
MTEKVMFDIDSDEWQQHRLVLVSRLHTLLFFSSIISTSLYPTVASAD